jgi:hypothetical protein
MCQRNLRLPVHLVTSGVVLVCVLLGGLLWGSARLKNKVDRWEASSGDVLKAAQSLVATNPAVRNPVSFSGIDQTSNTGMAGAGGSPAMSIPGRNQASRSAPSTLRSC